MLLTANQLHDLLHIIDKNQLVVQFQELGPDYLSDEEKKILKQSGVDIENAYKPEGDTIFTSFHYGLLSEALGAAAAKKMDYNTLKEYIKHGDYIPLTIKEQAAIATVKAQKLNDLKSLRGRIFHDVNQILTDKSLSRQREFLKEQLVQGILDKKTISEISNGIAEKTGDWSRDFDRIVAYNSTLAFENGKSAMIQRNAGDGVDPIVYKLVFEGACDHCIRLYLTKGIGSEPRLFKLSELKANGTNIGRKVKDWRATVAPVHPYCRCVLMYKPYGYEWDKKKKSYDAPEKYVPKRPLIRVWISGQERFV